MNFKANKNFKKQYKRIFRHKPEAANLFLLLCELADQKGHIVIGETELARLMKKRFQNPQKYELGRLAYD